MSEAARLSKMTWDAREQIEMWADSIDRRTSPNKATAVRRLVEQIDEYRKERGWSPDGFGGEEDAQFRYFLENQLDGNPPDVWNIEWTHRWDTIEEAREEKKRAEEQYPVLRFRIVKVEVVT